MEESLWFLSVDVEGKEDILGVLSVQISQRWDVTNQGHDYQHYSESSKPQVRVIISYLSPTAKYFYGIYHETN